MLIYKHTNKINNKAYIGKTIKTMEERLSEHVKSALSGSETPFHKAIRKYGIDNFTSEILENNINENKLNLKEIYWIDKENTLCNIGHGYNITKGGEGGDLLTNNPRREEILKNRPDNSGENHPNYGKKLTDNHKLKMSKSLKGQKKPKNFGKGNSNSSAIKINIFNAYDKLEYQCHGNFDIICSEYNLPHNALRKSYQNNTKLYESNNSKSKANNLGFFKYIGWYARKV